MLDAPEHLQLHASLDVFSSSPLSISSNQLVLGAPTVFWLDRRIVGTVLNRILDTNGAEDDERLTRIKEISDEGWDLFFRVLGDGSVVITAVSVRSSFFLEAVTIDGCCRILTDALLPF